ncbi:MAG: hypothetical protein WBP81_00350, partial [Solirubrobacteraceae bacterium]
WHAVASVRREEHSSRFRRRVREHRPVPTERPPSALLCQFDGRHAVRFYPLLVGAERCESPAIAFLCGATVELMITIVAEQPRRGLVIG